MALGIACAGTGLREAIALLEPMCKFDPVNFVRQGALVSFIDFLFFDFFFLNLLFIIDCFSYDFDSTYRSDMSKGYILQTVI